MTIDLDTMKRVEGESLPIPWTRVRVTYGGERVEGVVLPSWFSTANCPHVMVGFWLGGMPEIGLPATYEKGLFGRDKMEIISEPGEGTDGWTWPDDPYED
jgi:hypothetical protein